MKKQVYKLGLVAFLGLSAMTFAQQDGTVGINTDTPSATLDVKTKTGVTKSLRVENTNLEETVTVLNSGNVGIGNALPQVNLHIKGESDKNAEIRLERYGDHANGANMTLIKSRGTSLSPAGVQVGNSLGRYKTGGHTGGADAVDYFASSIETMVAAAPVAGKVPTNMFIRLTKDTGDRNTVLSMIGNNGNVGVGVDAPTEKLEVAGTIKSTDLAGSGKRNVVADADGKLVIGDAVASGGASLDAITGEIKEVQHIQIADWTPGVFALIQTGNLGVELPDPASYKNRIIAVNNQYTNSIQYASTNSPQNTSGLDSGKGHLLMSNGTGWYIIGGSY